jgi:hypothetical protein
VSQPYSDRPGNGEQSTFAQCCSLAASLQYGCAFLFRTAQIGTRPVLASATQTHPHICFGGVAASIMCHTRPNMPHQARVPAPHPSQLTLYVCHRYIHRHTSSRDSHVHSPFNTAILPSATNLTRHIPPHTPCHILQLYTPLMPLLGLINCLNARTRS